MKLELILAEEFGSRLSNGETALEFRVGRMDPYADICQQIILDFTGIRSANSSFINALISGYIEQHGSEILDKIVFKGCNPTIKVLVESAISLGIEKHRQLA
jgi:hypothetical protein